MRLGAAVKLISVIGDDFGGRMITGECRRMGLDLDDSLFLPGEVSSVYLALLDSDGCLALALSNMSILEKLTAEHLESKASLIEAADIIVADTGLAGSMLRHITGRFSGKKIFLDPVSARKAEKARSFIGGFYALKLNRMEAECLSGVPIPAGGGPAAREALVRAGDYFMDRGNRLVCITMGKDGVYLRRGGEGLFAPVRYVEPVNTSGGGDAFMAGMVYAALEGFDSGRTLAFASAMAAVTVQSRTTVAENMSLALIEQMLSEQTPAETLAPC